MTRILLTGAAAFLLSALLGYLLLAPVFWSSIKLGRHTPRELALGTVTPVVFILLLSLLFRA